MTLRHVVTWKVSGDTDEERDEVKTQFRERLLSLPPQVDVIRSFDVGLNDAGAADNFDVVLIAEFDGEDALQQYIHHSAHQEVVAYIRTHTAGRAAVDFTV